MNNVFFKQERFSKRRGRRGNIEFVAVNNVSQDAQQVSCAICNAEMSENYWIVHKEKNHNNLAWKTGDPPLVNLHPNQ